MMTPLDLTALALAALLLASMPLFGSISRGRAVDPEVARRPTTALLGIWVRDWLMWVLRPLESGLLRARAGPDALNAAGVMLGALAGLSFAMGALSIAGWCVLLGGVADVLDGRIARARGMADRRGEFLDSTLDRFSETFALAGAAVFFVGRPWAVAATTLALGGSMVVSYARARGEALGVANPGGLMQRPERIVVLGFAAVLDPLVTRLVAWPSGTALGLALVLLSAGVLATAAYRTWAIARILRQQQGGELGTPAPPSRRSLQS